MSNSNQSSEGDDVVVVVRENWEKITKHNHQLEIGLASATSQCLEAKLALADLMDAIRYYVLIVDSSDDKWQKALSQATKVLKGSKPDASST